jgi:hypothetical protein
MSNLILKAIFAAIGLALIVGCTPLILRDAVGSKSIRNVVVSNSEDELYGIGRIDNEKITNEFPSAIALVGKKQTYVLLDGADQLQKIAHHLDGNLLANSNASRKPANLNDAMTFSVKESEFFGVAWFIYKKNSKLLTEQERLAILSLGAPLLDKSTDYFSFSIRVSGFIPDKKVELRGDSEAFKAGRKINLVTTQQREEWVKYPNPLAFPVLPIAVVFDVVITAPLLLISSMSMKH